MTTTNTTTTPLRRSARTSRSPHGRRRVIARWIKRGALVAGALGVVGALVYAWMPRPVTVDTAIARHTALQVEVEEDGQTRVHDRFVIAAPISGELQRIELEPGDVVHLGQKVAEILPPQVPLLDARTRREVVARVAAAKARREAAATAIAKATAARDVAIREADRARLLVDRGAVPIAERDRAELSEQVAIRDLASARAERAAASAEVDAAEAALDVSRDPTRASATVAVTSPAAGQVLRTVRDSAGPVAVGNALLEVGDPSALEVVVDVLSTDAVRIAPGMPVAIERWGGDAPLPGRVLRVEPSAFTRISALGIEEQRVRVIVALVAPPLSLGDGFRVTCRIITWRGNDVLAVPSSAVFRDRGQWAIYEIVDGRAVLRTIEIGHRGRLDVEVSGGLAPGARVIVHPGDRVHPGARVAPASGVREASSS